MLLRTFLVVCCGFLINCGGNNSSTTPAVSLKPFSSVPQYLTVGDIQNPYFLRLNNVSLLEVNLYTVAVSMRQNTGAIFLSYNTTPIAFADEVFVPSRLTLDNLLALTYDTEINLQIVLTNKVNFEESVFNFILKAKSLRRLDNNANNTATAYEIYDWQDLQAIGKNAETLASSYALAKDIYLPDAASKIKFTPIGLDVNTGITQPFTGSLTSLKGILPRNKKAFTIYATNFTDNLQQYVLSETIPIGIFSTTTAANISDINLALANAETNSQFFGWLVGMATDGSFKDITVDFNGSVLQNNNISGLTGGLIGLLVSTSATNAVVSKATIKNGSIFGNTDGSSNTIGGIIGATNGNTSLAAIQQSSVYHMSLGNAENVGGVIGHAFGNSDIIATRVINSNLDSSINNAGGLIGNVSCLYNSTTCPTTSGTATKAILRFNFIDNLTIQGEQTAGGFIGNSDRTTLEISRSYVQRSTITSHNNAGGVFAVATITPGVGTARVFTVYLDQIYVVGTIFSDVNKAGKIFQRVENGIGAGINSRCTDLVNNNSNVCITAVFFNNDDALTSNSGYGTNNNYAPSTGVHSSIMACARQGKANCEAVFPGFTFDFDFSNITSPKILNWLAISFVNRGYPVLLLNLPPLLGISATEAALLAEIGIEIDEITGEISAYPSIDGSLQDPIPTDRW